MTYGPRDSRCLYPANAPQNIHWAHVDGDPTTVGLEVKAAIQGAVPKERLLPVLTDVNALIDRFQSCTAITPDDVRPIQKDPRLWEMRIDLPKEGTGLWLRIYYTEVPVLPGHIITLRAHQKQIVKHDPAATRALQDAEIDVASLRWDAGHSTRWGI